MKKFIIPIKFTFKGTVVVQAETREKAIEIINNSISAELSKIQNFNKSIVNWDICIQGWRNLRLRKRSN